LTSEKDLLKKAQAEIEACETKTQKTQDAQIIVTAAVTNSGDGSTTLKPEALLRTDLGQGNYLDFNLTMQKVEDSEVKPRGASVIKFASPDISSMAAEERQRFAIFSNNTSPTNLYVGDVRNNYYKSNTIPFAQGIYEQTIYDGLKRFATDSGR
jgi:hypothetical protein